MSYAGQVEAKRRILVELFHHRFPETSALDITMLGSPEAFGYRSRAWLQLRGLGADSVVGFFRIQSGEVEDVPACPLFRPLLNRALEQVRLSRRAGEGDPGLAEIEIAASEEAGRWAASPDPASGAGAEIAREVGGVRYATSPSSFFQANDFLTEPLVDAVKRLAAGTQGSSALELYCGVGLFTLPLARVFKNITAVENSALACSLCEKNAAAAVEANIRVVCADASAWAKAVGSVAAPGYDLVLLDPPRSGAGADLMEQLGIWAPESIVYVSCDPQTLCRDLALLPRAQYRIDSVEGLDLFPQTFHFETVVHLRRR